MRRAAFAAAATSLVLAAGATPALATDAYTVPLHQQVPITAASFGSTEKKCADIPSTQDGWHFVAPGNPNEISFVELTVTFEPGGQKVITSFGPPNDNHAYVASEPGAKLTSAVAKVKGGKLEWFNLSHTCPSTVTPSGTPSKTPSGTPSSTSSVTPSKTPSASVSPSGSVTPSRSAGGTPSGTPSATATSPAPVAGGDLANTGSGLPVALVSTLAALLVAAGGVLVVRRRRTQP
ncbi:LPXTG cell wall anchor domain-containing protein [Streptomyces sp. KS 21]|uniref:LPXTG cell wall anchor domain-containing protein n=1 Tax=Streptomyces sp. KS 21 TaxID=2485150 RepID=UPI001414EEFE|nr:LPXTG cell wall anchor domain-containing protein [Streptomyces sp. KS 21]